MALLGSSGIESKAGKVKPRAPRTADVVARDYRSKLEAESGRPTYPGRDGNQYFTKDEARSLGEPRNRPLRNDLEMSPAARRALEAFDAPAQRQLFAHETDIGNVESIRRSGIRPSVGGSAMGHEGVYAYEGGRGNRVPPEGRAIIEFEADPRRISGRGTTPGSKTVSLSGGSIGPEEIKAGWGPKGQRLFDAAGGLMALAQLAPMVPGFTDRFPRSSWALQGGPLGDWASMVMEDLRRSEMPTMEETYGPGGDPTYHRMGRGRSTRGRGRTTTYGDRYYYDDAGNMLA